jgi:hypothetical protein
MNTISTNQYITLMRCPVNKVQRDRSIIIPVKFLELLGCMHALLWNVSQQLLQERNPVHNASNSSSRFLIFRLIL